VKLFFLYLTQDLCVVKIRSTCKISDLDSIIFRSRQSSRLASMTRLLPALFSSSLAQIDHHRESGKGWLAVLKNHREAIVAMDFLTVPTTLCNS
jgi:hypothetical protein